MQAPTSVALRLPCEAWTKIEIARREWSFSVTTILQRAICDLHGADRRTFSQVMQRVGSELPSPQHPAGDIDLSGRLLLFALRTACELHRRHHGGVTDGCAFAPEVYATVWFDTTVAPKEAFVNWLTRWLREFDATHRPSPVREAARVLREEATQPLKIGELARRVGVSRSVLERGFAREYGMSPAAYRTAARVEVGMAALRQPGVKVTEAARQAGYRSATNFNAALRKLTSMTPSEARKPRTP